MKIKRYRIHFRHRQKGTLDDVFEYCEAHSLVRAKEIGKAIAAERGWWFMAAETESHDPSGANTTPAQHTKRRVRRVCATGQYLNRKHPKHIELESDSAAPTAAARAF